MKLRHRSYLSTPLFLVLFLAPIRCASAGSETESGKIDPKADKILRQFSDYFGKLESLSVDLTSAIYLQMEGLKEELSYKQTIAMQRPNKLSVIHTSEKSFALNVVYDGSNLYIYLPTTKQYMVEKAPKDLDSFLEEEPIKLGQGWPLVEFLMHTNPYDWTRKHTAGVHYTGLGEIDQVQHHKLKLKLEDLDPEIWIDAGDKPVVRRITADLTKQLTLELANNVPRAKLKNMKAEMEIHLQDWALNTDLPEDRFTFTPPGGAVKVDSFEPKPKPAKSHPLLGEPAPDFTLDLLEGGHFALSEQKNKNIVILDFWASWCSPCRAVMPILTEVAEMYKEGNVVLIAVNQGENPRTIRNFLKREKLTTTVALDRTGRVGSLFRVRGIPQTVIIDKDGTVQSVHVGFRQDPRSTLMEEIETLLAGRKLVSGSGT